MKKYKIIALFVMMMLVGAFVTSSSAFAVNANTILKKTLLNGLLTCYKDTYMVPETGDDTIYGTVSLSNLMTAKGRQVNDDAVLVPSKKLGNTLTQSVPGVSCEQLFNGYSGVGGSIEGLFGLYNKNFSAEGLGYKKESAIHTTNRCLWVTYKYPNGNTLATGRTNSICFAVKDDGTILYGSADSDGFFTLEDNNVYYFKNDATVDGASLSFDNDDKFRYGLRVSDPAYESYPPSGMDHSIYCGSNLGEPGKIKFTDPSGRSALKQCLIDGLTGEASVSSPSGDILRISNITVVDGVDGEGVESGAIYVKGGDYSGRVPDSMTSRGLTYRQLFAANKALQYFSGNTSFDNNVKFSERERYDVLEYYIKDAIDNNPNTVLDLESCYDSVGGLGNDYGAINGGKWCKIVGWENVYGDYNVVDSSNYYRLKTVDFEGVLKELKDVDFSRIDGGVEGLDVEDGGGNDDNDGTETEMTCANSGGAMSLGWIVCPILDWLGDAANNAYNDYVEPSLRVNPKLFAEGNEGVHTGWETFRNIANTFFIILLLVVIFSQLTGVGIDNYGIKKILPKLIVAAVLINLSYLLCLLAVDLSNILGNGLKAMFDGLSSQLPPPVLNIDGADSVGAIAPTAITGVAVLGALVLMVGAVWQNPAILLSLLVAALGIAIAIFFLFVLLAAREAAVIVLVVLSPLAVACYMLPNTKKMFDKWLKFFEALLLVYPIAGLLIGGGNYVSTLLLSAGFGSNGFLQAFTSMIVGIVPIFFIPTVLKSSFAAMGKIGGMLTGMGAKVSGAATKRIQGSEGYKAAQTRGYERKLRMKAGYDSKGQVTKRGAMKARFAGTKFGRAIGYQSLQAARVATVNKNRERDIQANAELRDIDLKYQNSLDPTDSTESILTARLQEAADSGDANAIFSVIEQMKKSNMQASHIANATRATLGGQSIGKMTEGQRKNFLEEFGKKYGNDFLKKDFEQAHWARMGGVSNTTGVSALNNWAANNIAVDDLKDEDVAALSSDRLNDLIAAGKISQSQAQRVWASNGNMDDTNRLILGAYGNNGMQITKADAQNALSGNYGGSAAGLTDEMKQAYTRRAAERTVIEDVDLVNRKGEVGKQTDNLIIEAGGATASTLGDISANTGSTASNTASSASSLGNIETNTGSIVSNTASSASSLGNIDKNTSSTAANTASSAASLSGINTNTRRTADGVDEVNERLRRHTDASMDAAVLNLDNDTLAEVATNPKADMDDPLRSVAEKEIDRRVQDGKMKF